jgi:hypothetical protein
LEAVEEVEVCGSVQEYGEWIVDGEIKRINTLLTRVNGVVVTADEKVAAVNGYLGICIIDRWPDR